MIENRERFNQFIDYSGLTFGTLHPTDIDGVLEYRNKGFILFEVKMNNVWMPQGQRIALTRITDALAMSKPAILFVARHNVLDPRVDVDASRCIVTEYYYKGQWWRGEKTLREMTADFIAYLEVAS